MDPGATDQAAAFRSWVLDPARGNEELFLAELIVETLEKETPDPRSFDLRFEADRRRQRRRALTPGYRPRLTRARIDAALVHWPKLKKIQNHFYYDRLVRDLSALRFVPGLQELDLHSELRDLEGLSAVPELKSLSLHDGRLTDLRGLRHVRRVTEVSLNLSHPWPEPAGLETLTSCTKIACDFMPCILEAVSAWPQVTEARLGIYGGGYPLKDLRRLPAMPALRKLTVSTASLAGIERFPALEFFEAQGIFEDLSPLAGHAGLRDLVLQGEVFEDLAPVARLPNLYKLTLSRERGILLDPLLEAPQLRAVEAPRCQVIATELASLHAAIAWGPQDFELDAPRPVAAIRAFTIRMSDPEAKVAFAAPEAPDERARAGGDGPTFRPAEGKWLRARLVNALDTRFRPGWGEVLGGPPGLPMVLIHRDVERQAPWEVLEVLREVLAIARFPTLLLVGFTDPIDEGYADDEGDEDELYLESPEEIEERRRRLREDRAFRDREHRLRLGVPISDTDPLGEDDLAQEEAEAAELAEEEGASNQAGSYEAPESLYLHLTLDHLWINEQWGEAARHFLKIEPEDWHALPEPPEKRPRLKDV